MNFNASRKVGQAGGIRKAKRVMGAPSTTPAFSPAPAYNPGFLPAGPPPPYQEGIQLETSQDFGGPAPPAGNFAYMGGFAQSLMANPAQLGSMLHQPIVQDMALQYGNQLATQGREAVQCEINKYVPVSRLRYYFAVDSRYVLRKLLLIVFPYTHKEWMVKYDQDTPVQPRYDINAPDLYIPLMGYVTYVLLAGFMLGLQHRFSPEQIGMQASSALTYIIFEMIMYLVTLYVTNTSTHLKTLDLLAFSGYKYTVMIGSLLAGLMLSRTGYYCSLVYTSFALSYFLVKTLRLQLLSGSQAPEQQAPYGYPAAPRPAPYGYPAAPRPAPYGYPAAPRPAPYGYPAAPRTAPYGYPAAPRPAPYGYPAAPRPAPYGYPAAPRPAPYGYPAAPRPSYAEGWRRAGGGTKHRVYFLLFVVVTQPLLSWWLTYHLVPADLPTPAR